MGPSTPSAAAATDVREASRMAPEVHEVGTLEHVDQKRDAQRDGALHGVAHVPGNDVPLAQRYLHTQPGRQTLAQRHLHTHSQADGRVRRDSIVVWS